MLPEQKLAFDVISATWSVYLIGNKHHDMRQNDYNEKHIKEYRLAHRDFSFQNI
jgi:hypothetical protein